MLFRHTSHYLTASAVSGIFGFLSAVAFTRLLDPAEYGIYVVGVSIGGFVSAVLFTWVRYSAMRFQSEGGSVDVRATSLAAYCLSAAMAPVAIAAVAYFSGLSLERAACVLMFSLGLSLFELGQELLKSRLQTRAYVLSSILRSVAAFGLCLVVAGLGGGGVGQLAMAAAAYFAAIAYSTPAIWTRPIAPVDLSKLKTFLRLGGPITISGFVFTFHSSLDRLFVAWSLGDSAAGLYGASADLIRQIILIPSSAVAAAAIPLAVRALSEGDEKEARTHLEESGELLLAILLPLSIGAALTSPHLASFLLGPAFRETATTIMPILAFAWLFSSVANSYVHISFHLAKRPELTIAHGAATLAVNLCSLWPLTMALGLPGAAVSLVLAEWVGLIVAFTMTRHAHPMPLLAGPLTRVVSACAIMTLAVLAVETLLPSRGAASFVALAASGMVAYGAAALWLDIAGARTLAAKALRRPRLDLLRAR
jgi:O-antigen/teichoic acid export membrane protein